MLYTEPEYEYEYELKCEQIATQIEMLVLDRIIAVLERLNTNLQPVAAKPRKTSDDIVPF